MRSETQRYVEVEGVRLPSRLLDSYQVHRAALAHGLHVLCLPRQVLLAGAETSVPAQVSFAHGVPEASGLSAVTFAQDQRLRRALLERSRVPRPKGATFSWRSIGLARRWAKSNGYPVVVKEGVGENPPREIRGVDSSAELKEAFNELRRRDIADRTPGNNPHIAGYATTRLTFTYDEEGNEVAPLRSRMLVEQDVAGQRLRAFVIGGRLITAVELDDNRAFGIREVTEEISTESTKILVSASQSVPGLACATVDAVFPASDKGEARHELLVTGVAERPRMESFASAGSDLAPIIGEEILKFQAKDSGLELGPVLDEVTYTLDVEGLRYSAAVAEDLPRLATNHGVRLEIKETDAVEGSLRGVVSGPPGVIAALTELLMAGYVVEDRASAVNYSKESQNA